MLLVVDSIPKLQRRIPRPVARSQPKLVPPKRNHPARFHHIPAQRLHQQIRAPLIRQRIDDALDAVARTHQHIRCSVRERSPDGAVREEVRGDVSRAGTVPVCAGVDERVLECLERLWEGEGCVEGDEWEGGDAGVRWLAVGLGEGGAVGSQLDLKLGEREGGALGDVFVHEKDDGAVSATFETVELFDAVGGLGVGHVIWAEEEEAEEGVASGEGAGGAEGDVVGSEGCFWGLVSRI